MNYKLIFLSCMHLSMFGMKASYRESLSVALRNDDQSSIESLFNLSNGVVIIEKLLKYNLLDPNMQGTQKGHALIHWAARANNTDVLEVLLTDTRTNPDIKNNNGCTALGFAVAQGKVLPVQLLLKYKANPNVINENKEHQGDRHSMLHSAIMGYQAMGISYRISYFCIIKSLLANVKTLVNMEDSNGKTPLHYAVLLGDTALVNLLLCCNRVNQDIKDNDNKTALDYARETNKQKLIKLLKNN